MEIDLITTRSLTGRRVLGPPGSWLNTVLAANVQFGWIPASVNFTWRTPRKKRIVTLPLHPYCAGIDDGPITPPAVLSTNGP